MKKITIQWIALSIFRTPDPSRFVSLFKGKYKNAQLLKIGLINATANPQKTDVKAQRSIDQRNSKKLLEKTEPQNTNAIKTSKLNEYERQEEPNDFEIRNKTQKAHRLKLNHNTRLKFSMPAKENRPASNRRIALIKEHLERINKQLTKRENAHDDRENAQDDRENAKDDRENAQDDRENAQDDRENAKDDRENAQDDRENAQDDRENAQDDRAHKKKAQLESGVPANNPDSIVAPVGKPETRVAKHVLHVDDNTSREDEHVLDRDEHVSRDGRHALVEEKVFSEEKHILSNEVRASGEEGDDIQSNDEHALLLCNASNSTPKRIAKDAERESSCQREPVIITRKIRKRWAKDFAGNFPAAQNLEDGQNEGPKVDITSRNCETQRTSNCNKVARVYITGGIRKNDYFAHKAILELDPGTGNCVSRGTMCTGRYNHGIAQLGSEIYLVGGNSGFFEQLRSVESYSPEHAQWTVKPSMREARDEFSLAVCGGCLYAIGGHNGIQDLRSVERFSPRENSWSFVSPMRNYRAGTCVVAVDDR